MSSFKIPARVWREGLPGKVVEVSLVVDTGATYTTLPSSLLTDLGVEAVRRLKLRLADGTMVERGFGRIDIDLGDGNYAPSSPVIFGYEGVYLLGAVTLEELSLGTDPVNKKLIPVDAYLFEATSTWALAR